MKIYKFGGASVKSANDIKNVSSILKNLEGDKIVVISAIGKITNALEKLCRAYYNKENNIELIFNESKIFHYMIVNQLFDDNDKIYNLLDLYFNNLYEKIHEEPSLIYNYEYDKIVSYGEIFSTLIVSEYLNKIGITNEWIDIRKVLKTDDKYREANILWDISSEICKKTFIKGNTYICQGFIAATKTNITTTLGREGSDYTGAILANILNADSLSILKDVPGVMNADPKDYSDATIISHLSYKECIELAHFGAKVIHPKTLKPLENKNIPLHVKSFINPNEEGTLVDSRNLHNISKPIFIHKREQVLVTLSPRDFSFIGAEELRSLFRNFSLNNVKVNLVESSAISFSICCDYREEVLEELFDNLKKDYSILYNQEVELITVRNYNSESLERVCKDKDILLEQKTRTTARFIVNTRQ